MGKIYVCSPLRPLASGREEAQKELEGNLKVARRACREIVLGGDVPICPHIYATQFLDDNVDAERNMGMAIGFLWLKESDELRVYGGRVSEGMKAEIDLAESIGIPVTYAADLGKKEVS